jgi:uncharacterized membrane protein
MPNTTLAGHPLHPQLVELPLSLLPFSFALDVLHAVTGKQSFADAAYYTMVGGCVGGLAAGAAGAMDYLTIPRESESHKVANVHAGLNLGTLGLYGLNLLLRSRRRRGTGVLPVIMSAVGTAGLIASAWYGSELVFKLGMRVEPAQEGEKPPEVKLPGDRKIERAFQKAEKALTGHDGAKKK